ncbi:hypothetical protein [Riemerella anatipestifer]|uniref:hypothetical protein n=1 Tax=Riemerella anatipestifer TaxID=34085 RepID=UPI0021F884FE|nr:hypothetical protein [Riemerella anatipestifer]MCW0487109.1 hypothetical protein [Riemerella anatipestifer]MDY3339518.1 hypothetical protein [Riemerella anatipestifer]
MDLRNKPTLKQAHLQTAQADTQTKVCKRACFANPKKNCFKILPTLQKTNEKETEYGQQITRVWRNGGVNG